MIDPMGATAKPVVLNGRTPRMFLRRVGWFVGVACVGELAFALGFGWQVGLAYYLSVWLVGWLASTSAVTEWTIAGRELGRRRWHSPPGRKPTFLMELGPQVECVHVAWGRWLVLGPQVEPVHVGWARWLVGPSEFSIAVDPWESARLVGAMDSAGVRITDWRGAWERRHRVLNALGLLAYYGSLAGLFVAIALAPAQPTSILSFAGFGVVIGALCVGLAIDYLPWKLRKTAAPPDRARAAGAG